MEMINGQTKVIGLLGNPVNHSLSPIMQNAAIKEMNLNLCYLAFPCEERELSIVLDSMLAIKCQGLNVTIPHKNSIAKLCRELSPLAKSVGAVNTLLPRKEGGWYGTNTDIEGFISPLINKKGMSKDKAIIIGSGGSARAVLAGLRILEYKKIIIIARNIDSLNKFLADTKNDDKSQRSNISIIGILASDSNIVTHIQEANLIINTTPIGLQKIDHEKNQPQKMPLSEKIWMNLEAKTTLYDLIYVPRPTEWLKLGKAKGCQTIDGLEMLIQQGAASLRIWTGKDKIPIELMRKAAEKQLNI